MDSKDDNAQRLDWNNEPKLEDEVEEDDSEIYADSSSSLRGAYGFITYLSSIVILAILTTWQFVPDTFLDQRGFLYRLQKVWFLIVPGYLFFTAYTYIALKVTLDLLLTPTIKDWCIVHDPKSNLKECFNCTKSCTCNRKENLIRNYTVEDVPLHMANLYLYGK